MQYQLNISIDAETLQQIYASGSAVVITRSSQVMPLTPYTVAWQVFEPMEANQVSWDSDCQVYASNAQPLIGAQIAMTAAAPAQPGWRYVFENLGQPSASAGGNAPQGFEITNQIELPELFCFGAAQAATVNGVSTLAPFSLFRLPGGQSGTVTPFNTVMVFIASGMNSGCVIQEPPLNALTVPLGPDKTAAQIGFNDATQSFYLTE